MGAIFISTWKEIYVSESLLRWWMGASRLITCNWQVRKVPSWSHSVASFDWIRMPSKCWSKEIIRILTWTLKWRSLRCAISNVQNGVKKSKHSSPIILIWRPAILRLHQGHLEAMKLSPPGALFFLFYGSVVTLCYSRDAESCLGSRLVGTCIVWLQAANSTWAQRSTPRNRAETRKRECYRVYDDLGPGMW